MLQRISKKEAQENINNLCIKTYLEILGYKPIVSHRTYAIFPSPFSEEGTLYVDLRTNKARLSTRKTINTVLDLASALFQARKNDIMDNIVQYRIDQLINYCNDRMSTIL